MDVNDFDPDTVKFVSCALPEPAPKGQKRPKQAKNEKEDVAVMSFSATEAAVKVIQQDNKGIVYHCSSKDPKPKLMLESSTKTNRPVALKSLTAETIKEYYTHRG